MHPGDIIAGKYRVANILGRQRGLLVEAYHTEFDQHVVMRLLSPAMCDDKQLEQFRREARTLSKLESEHVARILDVGTHSDGSFFLVRQHLEGIELAAHIKNQGALRLDEAVMYILQASEAVQECHSHNIVLRELQPAHLFITRKRGGLPVVKITDFGTAKILKDPAGEAAQGEMTATVMFGMSQYSSPELVRKARDIDPRTDVWSLGCILYEMLAAVPPFQGEMAELMLKITREEPIPLSNLRPDLPREFDQIIGWALAKDRDARFSSVYAFAHALKAYASTEGQVLIDQIGRLAHTKPTSQASSQISPTSPLAKRSSRPAYQDDDATVIRPAPFAPGSSPGYGEESEFEKTTFLPDARGSQPPPPHSHAGRGSVPPPPASYPGSVPPPAYSAPGSIPPPSAPPSHGSVPPPRSRQGSWVEADPAAAGAFVGSAGGFPQSAARPKKRSGMIIAIGACLVLLPVLVVAAVFAFSGPEETAVAVNDTAPAKVEPKAEEPPEEKAAEPADTSAGGAVPEPSAKPVADEPKDEDKEKPQPSTPVAPVPRPTPKPQPDKVSPKPPPKPEPPPPPSSSGGTGTLVAIAIGGSCAFAVDGAPKGTKSSIRITVPVGPHTVSCTPPKKATRTQRVNVKEGKPGIASFRLN